MDDLPCNVATMVDPSTVPPENPVLPLAEKKCLSCEGAISPLSNAMENSLKLLTPGWEIERIFEHRISRTFGFASFGEAINFVNRVATIAEAERHHPEMCINYRKVIVELRTHAIGGLSENDFIVAAKINEVAYGGTR